jgi:spoIIIJ-associated protein
MEFIEVSAKTVDDAITKACIELQAASDKLEIQVISEGSSGFFGIGSKPAVIRAAVKAAPEKEPETPQKPESGADGRQHRNGYAGGLLLD